MMVRLVDFVEHRQLAEFDIPELPAGLRDKLFVRDDQLLGSVPGESPVWRCFVVLDRWHVVPGHTILFVSEQGLSQEHMKVLDQK